MPEPDGPRPPVKPSDHVGVHPAPAQEHPLPDRQDPGTVFPASSMRRNPAGSVGHRPAPGGSPCRPGNRPGDVLPEARWPPRSRSRPPRPPRGGLDAGPLRHPPGLAGSDGLASGSLQYGGEAFRPPSGPGPSPTIAGVGSGEGKPHGAVVRALDVSLIRPPSRTLEPLTDKVLSILHPTLRCGHPSRLHHSRRPSGRGVRDRLSWPGREAVDRPAQVRSRDFHVLRGPGRSISGGPYSRPRRESRAFLFPQAVAESRWPP